MPDPLDTVKVDEPVTADSEFAVQVPPEADGRNKGDSVHDQPSPLDVLNGAPEAPPEDDQPE